MGGGSILKWMTVVVGRLVELMMLQLRLLLMRLVMVMSDWCGRCCGAGGVLVRIRVRGAARIGALGQVQLVVVGRQRMRMHVLAVLMVVRVMMN